LIEAFAAVENTGPEAFVDAYVAIVLPDETIVCLGPDGFDVGIWPRVTNIFLPADVSMGPLQVFELTVPADAAPGSYLYAAGLSPAGRKSFISTCLKSFEIRVDE